jgi:hypothetical protein
MYGLAQVCMHIYRICRYPIGLGEVLCIAKGTRLVTYVNPTLVATHCSCPALQCRARIHLPVRRVGVL